MFVGVGFRPVRQCVAGKCADASMRRQSDGDTSPLFAISRRVIERRRTASGKWSPIPARATAAKVDICLASQSPPFLGTSTGLLPPRR